MAGIHLAFAFPLISKILLLIWAAEESLLIIVTACCYLVFAPVLCDRVCDHFERVLHNCQWERKKDRKFYKNILRILFNLCIMMI